MSRVSRRLFIGSSSIALLALPRAAPAVPGSRLLAESLPEGFPAQAPEAARAVVGASHANYEKVHEMVTGRPALAKANWDWGFGDWESALGAASHTGRRDIAELLIAHGARPNLFTFAMLDQVDVVRAICTVNPGIQRLLGPHGITLMTHARNGKAERVIEYLESLGDADVGQPGEPMDRQGAAPYLGDYAPRGAEEMTIVVGYHDRFEAVTLKAGTGPFRGLSYRGDHRFNPAGAPAVEIAFDVTGARARHLTITDGSVVVEATRAG